MFLMLKPQTLVLQVEHVSILQQNLRTGKTEHRVARRSQILLLRAEGRTPSEVADNLRCGRNTVWRVEERYRAEQLDALYDRRRPGRPRHFSPAAES
jgi:transposase